MADGPDKVTLGGVLHTRPLALLPEPTGALLGKVPKDSADWKRIAGEAARTIPGRVTCMTCHPCLLLLTGSQPCSPWTALWLAIELCSSQAGCQHLHLAMHRSQDGRCCKRVYQSRRLGRTDLCRRENGGNCDIKNLTKGCKVYFPGEAYRHPLTWRRCRENGFRYRLYGSQTVARQPIMDPLPVQCLWRAPSSRWETCTSARATARCPSVAPLR